MKKLLKIILLIFLIQISSAQEVKMITEWNEAKKLAENENKRILIILTGSEWCAPCKKLEKNVIQNIEFQKYAEQNLIVFLIDIPGGIIDIDSKLYKKYRKFEKKYEANTLPSLILTESNGIKIKTLKGKMFKLDKVLKQLKS